VDFSTIVSLRGLELTSNFSRGNSGSSKVPVKLEGVKLTITLHPISPLEKTKAKKKKKGIPAGNR
jgi:hypothetical protein